MAVLHARDQRRASTPGDAASRRALHADLIFVGPTPPPTPFRQLADSLRLASAHRTARVVRRSSLPAPRVIAIDPLALPVYGIFKAGRPSLPPRP